MADQRAALVKVERENGLILNEAFACMGHLPEALRDPSFARLETRREAFQRSVDALYNLLQQDHPAGSGADSARILERLSKLEKEMQDRPPAAGAEMARVLERLSKLEKENQELRRRAEERPAAPSAEIARMSERLLKLERENQELRRGRVEAAPVPLASPAAACAEPEAEEVVMNDRFATGITLSFSGGLAQEGGKIVKREDASERWTAGGIAYFPKIEAGTRKGVQFQPCQNDMSAMLGFQHCVGLPSPPHSMGELEVAAHCAKDGTLEIFSQGERVGQCGKYRPSSIVELSITEAGEVGLFMDGQFLFRLAKPPRFPLYVAASFLTPGAAIRGLTWTEGSPLPDVPRPAPAPPQPPGPRGPVNFVGMSNGLQQLQPGHLKKTGGANAYDAGAVSTQSFVVGQGRGLRFRPGTADKSKRIGLGSQSAAPTNYQEIEYTALCNGSGQFYVFEGGAQKFSHCPYSRTSTVELRVTEAHVEFLLDGVLKHTSQLRGQQRLYAMAYFGCVGAEALDIEWL